LRSLSSLLDFRRRHDGWRRTALLDRLILRRSDVLQAVEIALDVLSDAVRCKVPRGHPDPQV
jgi:hypothetical protein